MKTDIKKKAVVIKTTADLKNLLGAWQNSFDPDWVLNEVRQNLEAYIDEHNVDYIYATTHPLHKALTLSEFDNGYLLSQIVTERFATMAIEMSRSLQEEYQCKTHSQKATAELVALNYIRILELQENMNKYLSDGYLLGIQQRMDDSAETEAFLGKKRKKTTLSLKFLEIMSKELENAQRFYHASLHLLRSLKQPSLQVNIKTNTAIIGNNQVVQANNF